MSSTQSFDRLGLSQEIQKTLSDLGYESPSPVQQQSIPSLLEGRDLLAQAQTGTGKTAAFALPILMKLDLTKNIPQALVLTPTRELAIQVAESFKSYAKYLRNFRVLAIYGGQDYNIQLKALARGVHVIVGTPGRVMDHLRREKINVAEFDTVVLDEADEMLNMGFIDDVKWILEQIPGQHQTALFSATMPRTIQEISNNYLKNPVIVQIKPNTETVSTIEQLAMIVSRHHKLEALTRFLEIESFNAVLIFSRTKTFAEELSEKLEARGYSATALHGDMKQASREKVISRIKSGSLDMIVATDVAARGLDVDRITHVINYDIPHDVESYIHRIGRTGRAGRSGKALIFISPRERGMLKDIERHLKQPVSIINPPSLSQVNEKRLQNFSADIIDVIAKRNLDSYRELIEKIAHESEVSEIDIAAALAFQAQKGRALDIEHDELVEEKPIRKEYKERKKSENQFEEGMIRCRIEVGRRHGVNPGNIVGMIANESGISRKSIGAISIHPDFSFVDLEDSIRSQVIKKLARSKILNQPIFIKVAGDAPVKKNTSRRDRKF